MRAGTSTHTVDPPGPDCETLLPLQIDDAGRIVDFAEKPKGAELRAMEVDTTVLGLDAERCRPSRLLPTCTSPNIAGHHRSTCTSQNI